MALLFMDSFDLYGATEDMTRRWDHNRSTTFTTYDPVGGAFGGGAVRMAGVGESLSRTITASQTVIVHSLFKAGVYANETLFFFRESGLAQVEIEANTSAHIVAKVGTTTVETSSLTLPVDQYVRIEVRVSVAASGGSIEVRVEDVVYIDFTGDTQSTVNAVIDFMSLASGASGTSFWDDVVIMDGLGTANNDFIGGDYQIEALIPDGDSAQIDFTPTGAGTTNSDRIDDGLAGPDDDTTYVESLTPGHKDRYTLPALVSSTVGPILAVQNAACMRKVEAGTVVTALVTESNGTEDITNTVPQSTDYHYKDVILETDPDTGSAWTKSAVEAAEIGQTIVS